MSLLPNSCDEGWERTRNLMRRQNADTIARWVYQGRPRQLRGGIWMDASGQVSVGEDASGAEGHPSQAKGFTRGALGHKPPATLPSYVYSAPQQGSPAVQVRGLPYWRQINDAGIRREIARTAATDWA